MSSIESSATRQAGRYDWIILRRIKRYGLRIYNVLPSIYYLRIKPITRSPRDYSHKHFIREFALRNHTLLCFARTRATTDTCDMISTILASDQAEWPFTLMKTFSIGTQQQKNRARARRPVDILPSRQHFHVVEQEFRTTNFHEYRPLSVMARCLYYTLLS